MYGDSGGAEPSDLPVLRPMRLTVPARYKPLDTTLLDAYKRRHPYLGERGISEEVQRLCQIGYDQRSNTVTIPWFNADGSLGNIKYRRVNEKTFWYLTKCPACLGDKIIRKGRVYNCASCGIITENPLRGRPIREMVYALNLVYERKIKRAAIVEAEIDAMTLWTAGMPAIATGGTAFTATKRDLIIRSPIEEIIVIRDNDRAGRDWQRRVIAELSPYMSVRIATIPSRYKDVNEGREKVAGAVSRSRRLELHLLSNSVGFYQLAKKGTKGKITL